MKQFIWFIKQILALIYPAINNGQGSLKALVKNKISHKSLFDDIHNYHRVNGHPFDHRFGMTLIQDYSNPNTFNDWLLLQVDGKFRKLRVTGEGGDKKPRKGWRGRWLPGYYKDIFFIARHGKEFKFIGEPAYLPALAHLRQVLMFNIETGRDQMSAGCHIHGRESRSDFVGWSSLGCIVTKVGHAIKKVVAFVKTSYIYKLHGLSSKFSLTVALKNEFPDITGVQIL